MRKVYLFNSLAVRLSYSPTSFCRRKTAGVRLGVVQMKSKSLFRAEERLLFFLLKKEGKRALQKKYYRNF
jgi:hypothetical protein